MSLRINDEAPDFSAETTQGTIKFHDWIGDGWAILFSHPKDFTPVCTTELGYTEKLRPEFEKRNTRAIGLSVDPIDSHGRWSDDIEATQGVRLKYANGVEVIHKNGGFGVSFFGEKGKVLVNRGRFELWLGEEKQADPTKTDPAKKPDAIQSASLAEKQYLADAKIKLYSSNDHKTDWLNAIKERKKPICDVETGARSVTVCHLVNLAYYHGENMKWDPAKNQFVDGAGKNEWLNVPHRGEWKV